MTPAPATPFVPLFDAQPLRPLLARGLHLLTPNRRLASRIRSALVATARAQGVGVLPTPPVQALADWLDDLWQQGLFLGLDGFDVWVLNPAQEQVLWEQVIRNSAVGQSLLRPTQAAELAADALRSIVLWRQWPLPNAQRGYFSDADSSCFLEWLDAFQVLCREQGCITAVERDQRVIAALKQNQLTTAPIALVCFDEIAPLYAEAFDYLHAESVAIASRNQKAAAVACESFEQQIRAAARWIRKELQSGDGPFALVVPDLGVQRQRVERILLDEFNPDHFLPSAPRQLPPVNFSAGEPLANVPIVQTALHLIGLALPENSRADVIALLQSPFHGIDASQQAMVVTAIETVCDLLTEEISGEALRAISAEIAARHDGWAFDRALLQLADHWRRLRLANARLLLSQWGEHFRFVLMTFGWPGTRTLDSLEYQQVTQWWELFGTFAAFDNVCGALSFSAALTQLRQLAQSHVFQPKTADAPIQVLGLLEAAGLQFEGVWLCDMGDDRWPPAAAPHPLLPRDWQRRLRMPHCDAEREFAIAQRLSASLRANARQFIVSYQCERDEVERHVSPLFAAIPAADLSTLALNVVEPFKPEQITSLPKTALQSFEPGAAPPLDLKIKARGGSALFADQAACPFRAFARHRLNAEPLGEPQTGLSAAERGTLLHAALQSIWSQLQNSAALRACDAMQLQRHADNAALYALQQVPDLQRFGERFLSLERQRLARVIVHWLDLEKERADFEIVALEQDTQFKFAGLELRLRVDRIDRLPDGRVEIIDYKSGQGNSNKAWLGERPEQPQLPLYALTLEQQEPGSVAGILFAQVRLDNARWAGLGDTNLEAYKLDAPKFDEAHDAPIADWAAQKQFWEQALQTLAEEFIAGRADVAPSSPKSCQYCALSSVCRIDHSELVAGEEEESA